MSRAPNAVATKQALLAGVLLRYENAAGRPGFVAVDEISYFEEVGPDDGLGEDTKSAIRTKSGEIIKTSNSVQELVDRYIRA